jgi:hypothetical protein
MNKNNCQLDITGVVQMKITNRRIQFTNWNPKLSIHAYFMSLLAIHACIVTLLAIHAYFMTLLAIHAYIVTFQHRMKCNYIKVVLEILDLLA